MNRGSQVELNGKGRIDFQSVAADQNRIDDRSALVCLGGADEQPVFLHDLRGTLRVLKFFVHDSQYVFEASVRDSGFSSLQLQGGDRKIAPSPRENPVAAAMFDKVDDPSDCLTLSCDTNAVALSSVLRGNNFWFGQG